MTNEELVIEYQTGNKAVIEQLYLQNRGMIEKIVRRYAGIEELDDLRQESFFGLVKAAELWKPENETAFMTYAAYWIRAAIVRYIEECGGVVRIPSHKRALINRYNKAVNNYRVRFGMYPSDIELRALLELTQEQLERLKADIQSSRIRSTSEIIGGEDDDITLEDTLTAEGDQYEDVIDKIQHEQLSDTIWSCVDDLKPQHASVIRGHFGEGKTLKECGESLGVSTERARQLEQGAIRELRKSKYSKRLRPFLTEQGAYTIGLKFNGIGAFERVGSSQERAMMFLEQMSGMSLWAGKVL